MSAKADLVDAFLWSAINAGAAVSLRGSMN